MAVPNLVAHRGCMEYYPENTLVSLEAAIQGGASYIEFDLQCSADGELIVIHDTSLQRTCGVAGNIFEMSYGELKNIRAHEPDRFSLAFFKQKIPHLKDIVRLLKKYPHVTAFVEIKDETIDHFGINNVIPNLLYDLETVFSQCIIISYHYDALRYVREHSHYKIGWILTNYNDISKAQAGKLNPDFMVANHNKIPAETHPWEGDWQWLVYEVNDPYQAIDYASYDIGYVETRDICHMLQHPLMALNVG